MPWEERKALELRKDFVRAAATQQDSHSELCRKFAISRVTGYKWLRRFNDSGEAGLEELSRAPQHSPQAISESTVQQIVTLREKHPRWGPRKLRAYWAARHPTEHWPALSSIGELLKREGLSHPRRKRARTPPYEKPLQHAQSPNQVWCTDFKGWFLCGDGTRCDPLTITDAFSRYLLRVRIVDKADGTHVRAVFEAVFREFGMPQAIRSDNGAPFASKAPGGLSRLSMWWLQLGIDHERIEPGCPEQNGRHERMHQALKLEAASPPCANRRQQQQALTQFEWSYNHERPHQALHDRTPSELYVASARVYPSRLPELQYPEQVQHYRRIAGKGELKWKGVRTFLSEVLAQQTVGLCEIEEDVFEVYFGRVLLGYFDGHAHRFAATTYPPKRRAH
jgi:putative transposase